MEPNNPHHMSDEQRLELALTLLDEAYTALCWIGTGRYGIRIPDRPKRVQKAIDRLDKTMMGLEREQADR